MIQLIQVYSKIHRLIYISSLYIESSAYNIEWFKCFWMSNNYPGKILNIII